MVAQRKRCGMSDRGYCLSAVFLTLAWIYVLAQIVRWGISAL